MLICVVERMNVFMCSVGRWIGVWLSHPGSFSPEKASGFELLYAVFRDSSLDRGWELLSRPEVGPEVESKFGLSVIGGGLDK